MLKDIACENCRKLFEKKNQVSSYLHLSHYDCKTVKLFDVTAYLILRIATKIYIFFLMFWKVCSPDNPNGRTNVHHLPISFFEIKNDWISLAQVRSLLVPIFINFSLRKKEQLISWVILVYFYSNTTLCLMIFIDFEYL